MSDRELEAGREMDMLVSEMMGGNFRPYSTDYDAALPLLDDETDVEIEKAGGNWTVFLVGKMTEGKGRTLQLAICRAKLAARAATEGGR